MYKFLSFSALVALAAADCPNACSGHGLCSEYDACKCDPGYMGNDCSQRVCQFGLSFVDTPRGDLNHDGDAMASTKLKVQWSNGQEYELFNPDAATGEAHFYDECSGKGECDRASGECKCYEGYTGSACQRATCANDCSGHGVCRTLREIAKDTLNKRAVGSFAGHVKYSGVRNAFSYDLWDADKAQACVCDPGYTGYDCSARQCPRGDDPLTTSQQFCGNAACTWEKQVFTLENTGETTYKLAWEDPFKNMHYAYFTVDVAGNPNGLGFLDETQSKTLLPGPTTVAGQIMAALRAVPGGLLQRVEVYPQGSNPSSVEGRTFQIEFKGVSGNLESIKLSKYSGSASASPNFNILTLSNGNFESIECSGRGNCDSTSGLCKCFTGYFGSACEYLNALSA